MVKSMKQNLLKNICTNMLSLINYSYNSEEAITKLLASYLKCL